MGLPILARKIPGAQGKERSFSGIEEAAPLRWPSPAFFEFCGTYFERLCDKDFEKLSFVMTGFNDSPLLPRLVCVVPKGGAFLCALLSHFRRNQRNKLANDTFSFLMNVFLIYARCL